MGRRPSLRWNEVRRKVSVFRFCHRIFGADFIFPVNRQSLFMRAARFEAAAALALGLGWFVPLAAGQGGAALRKLDLFGDETLRKVDIEDGPARGTFSAQNPAQVSDWEAMGLSTGAGPILIFPDGRGLKGELAGITRQEVLWRLPGASATLHFGRDEIWKVLCHRP